jgi:hypothetical protein
MIPMKRAKGRERVNPGRFSMGYVGGWPRWMKEKLGEIDDDPGEGF